MVYLGVAVALFQFGGTITPWLGWMFYISGLALVFLGFFNMENE
jgi:hypothetical protein